MFKIWEIIEKLADNNNGNPRHVAQCEEWINDLLNKMVPSFIPLEQDQENMEYVVQGKREITMEKLGFVISNRKESGQYFIINAKIFCSIYKGNFAKNIKQNTRPRNLYSTQMENTNSNT